VTDDLAWVLKELRVLGVDLTIDELSEALWLQSQASRWPDFPATASDPIARPARPRTPPAGPGPGRPLPPPVGKKVTGQSRRKRSRDDRASTGSHDDLVFYPLAPEADDASGANG
jgi:hypothetical protein